MAASLKGIDPSLKQYLKINRLPDVYEALLSGLAIMCPDDPYQFIIDNLGIIKMNGLDKLQWDMFISDDMRPASRIVGESNLDCIFNFDENLQPTPEMYEKAYEHYNTKLKMLCFNGWMQFHLCKRHQRSEMSRKVAAADTHYRHRILRIRLHTWIQWLRFRKGRQAMAYNKIEHVYNVAIGRVIFEAWHNVTLDAKRTREYFERLERGENMEDEEVFGKGSGEARDDISILPTKVAIKIFSFVDIADLARCACVCRSWKVLTQASSLWTRLDLTRVRHRVTDYIATKLLYKCRPYLVHLNLRACSLITQHTFVCIRECRNLQDLNLSECPALNDDTLKLVAEACKILLYLNISHTSVTDASLRTIAKNCSNLQYLSLAGCKRFTDKGLLYLASGKGARKLAYLDLSSCIQLTANGFTNLATGCSQLQSLVLNDLFTLDDNCMQAISEKCKNLRMASFLGSPTITDETLKRLASGKRLAKIKLESNHKVTDASFKQIGKSCHDLRHLYMIDCQQITDLTLKSLSLCRNLTVINLADCVRVSDTGVRYIVESTCGSKLQELNLTNCVRVGDIALVNIHKRCHSLTYLSVCFCEHISEAGIELLGQTHSLTSLDTSGCNCGDVVRLDSRTCSEDYLYQKASYVKMLNFIDKEQGLSALGNNPRFKDVSLSECVAITDLGLQKFAQQCAEIERLDLSHCQNITDGAIKNLAFCCRMLTSLNLAGCKLLTDLSIQYLSGVCHYLRILDISGSLHITDKALKYLRKGCKKLQTISMLYCKGISKHAAHKMCRYVPEVHHNDDDVPGYFSY